MANSHVAVRDLRGIQQSFPMLLPRPVPMESKGVVYTKRWVVELMLDLAGYVSTKNLIDVVALEPSAGEGAFLLRMIERLVDSCERLKRPISDCRNSLIAYELDELSAARAKTLAAGALLNRGVGADTAESLAQSWVRVGDYLFDSVTVDADFVIGNPPYVRLEEIPEETAQLYRDAYSTMRGRADLYVAFFEAALRQLKPNAVSVFICPDRWMRNQYGAELRQLIAADFSVDIVIEMHQADAFHDEVDAYPAITVIRHKKQGSTLVASVGPAVEEVPSAILAGTLETHGSKSVLPPGLRVARVDQWFRGGEPWPYQSPQQLALLRLLEERFSPLEANARVGIGVATGNDRVFVTKDAHLVEPSRLLKLALAKDINAGAVNWSGHYLVNPWDREGLVSLEQYPCLRSYFEEHESALKKRHTAIRSMHAWYKTIDRVTLSLLQKPKLYIADIRSVLNPVLDKGETYPHHNLYFIESDVWDLEVLGGLLISAIGQFFIGSYGVRMRGGYLRFQAQYLRRIRVPNPKLLSNAHEKYLMEAFRSRDRQLATEIALDIYGIEKHQMEDAIAH